jgi:hypothetical protein
MNEYPEMLDKVALAVESTKVAKSLVVQQEGIGEDLNFSLMAWTDGDLRIVVQLKNEYMKDHEDRYERLVQAACIIRQGWGATAFTMVAEGFCSTNPAESKGKDLAQLFAAVNVDYVRECLAFTHIEEDDILFVVVPYSYVPPRKVLFSDVLQHRGASVLRDGRYPLALFKALELEDDFSHDDYDEDIVLDVLARGLVDLGFEVNYR